MADNSAEHNVDIQDDEDYFDDEDYCDFAAASPNTDVNFDEVAQIYFERVDEIYQQVREEGDGLLHFMTIFVILRQFFNFETFCL